MMTRRTAAATAAFVMSYALLLGAPGASAQDGVDGMRLLGRNNDEFAHMMDFMIVGDYGYASVGLGAGFQTYDISDPANPIRVSSLGWSGWRAHARGDTAYNFLHFGGVQVFDISAGSPVLRNGYDPPEADVSYEGGVRVGDLLYVAAHQHGIDVLDLGTPGSISRQSRITLADNACWNVVESDGYLFVANGRHGFSVVDLSGIPAEVATVSLPGFANDIEVDGTVAFLSLAAYGVAAVDISDPENPHLLDRAPTLGNAFSMGIAGNVLAVGSYPYAEWFDVSDPSAIERAGWDATLVYAMGADAGVISGGDTVIVVADWRGMGVYAPEDDVAGDIDVYPTRLDFGPVDAAGRDTTVIVRNTGGGSLQVTSISAPLEMAVNPGVFTLGPGETQLVTVTVAGTGSVRSTIRYYSDDPDEPESVQYVYKNNATFPQIGSAAPDFTMPGNDGQSHSLSDYLGRVIYLEFGASW